MKEASNALDVCIKDFNTLAKAPLTIFCLVLGVDSCRLCNLRVEGCIVSGAFHELELSNWPGSTEVAEQHGRTLQSK